MYLFFIPVRFIVLLLYFCRWRIKIHIDLIRWGTTRCVTKYITLQGWEVWHRCVKRKRWKQGTTCIVNGLLKAKKTALSRALMDCDYSRQKDVICPKSFVFERLLTTIAYLRENSASLALRAGGFEHLVASTTSARSRRRTQLHKTSASCRVYMCNASIALALPSLSMRPTRTVSFCLGEKRRTLTKNSNETMWLRRLLSCVSLRRHFPLAERHTHTDARV